MSGVTHVFADNSFGIGHGDENCACGPVVVRVRKAVSSGRGGSHQGYRATTTVRHNVLPKS